MRIDSTKQARFESLIRTRTEFEPGTVGAEFNEAFEEFKKTYPIPDSVLESDAYDEWDSRNEVQRYRRIKLIIWDIKRRQPELNSTQIHELMLSDVPEWTESPYLLPLSE